MAVPLEVDVLLKREINGPFAANFRNLSIDTLVLKLDILHSLSNKMSGFSSSIDNNFALAGLNLLLEQLKDLTFWEIILIPHRTSKTDLAMIDTEIF